MTQNASKVPLIRKYRLKLSDLKGNRPNRQVGRDKLDDGGG